MAMALSRRRGALIIKSIPSYFSPSSHISRSFSHFSSHLSRGVRPVIALTEFTNRFPLRVTAGTSKCMSTTLSVNDPQPNSNNRSSSGIGLLDDGCDFQHWLILMEKPEGEPTRDEIIDTYIKTLSKVLGSEEEARMKIYSVSTRHYFAFGALVSEELSKKITELPGVRWVVPDSYEDFGNKSYRGEPFINGQAVPYDPKYHEEYICNQERARTQRERDEAEFRSATNCNMHNLC